MSYYPISLNKVEKVILRKLVKNLYAMDRKDLVNGIPESPADIGKALSHLGDLGYTVVDLTSSGCVVSVPEHMRQDTFKIVFPGSLTQEETPIEDQIPKGFNNTPLFTAKGEKTIKAANADYWFCSRTNEPDFIVCFVFMRGVLTHSINLGSLSDFGSLISQALRKIDDIFESKPFLKSDLVHRLPHEVVGNRQPIKAITEYLCYEKYLVRMVGSKFQRTGKMHKVSTIDEIAFYRNEKHQSAKINTTSGLFAYTDENGLYPVLS
jgi:hypothetical protein